MKTLEVNLANDCYNIYMQKNIFNWIKQYLENQFASSKIAIITDFNLRELYGENLKKIIDNSNLTGKIIAFKPGEESKSMETLQEVYRELSDFNIGRKDLIITFGGGVVGDLGGFAAATYMRGIPYIQVPTSLLAQVDSSIGGKVAVDLPYGKNLIGSFYHPRAVFIDPELLKTLDKRFFRDGLAEVIKYGCIKERKILDLLMKYKNEKELMEDIENIVYTCCSIKKAVVERDEKDQGERMLLNFGHTLGHGLEKYFDYKKYTHGEAVAIGMMEITRKSEDLRITEKGTTKLICEVLKKYDIPHSMPEVNKQQIMNILKLDKKHQGDEISLIILEEIGKAIVREVSLAKIESLI